MTCICFLIDYELLNTMVTAVFAGDVKLKSDDEVCVLFDDRLIAIATQLSAQLHMFLR